MEVIGLPFFFIFWLIVELQGNTFGSYCVLISFSRASFRCLGITSLLHLAKVNAVEQYIAVKHSLCYEITVTEARLSGVSSLLWTITLLSTFLTNNNKYVRFDFGLTFLCVASIFSCQIVLFYETRRHKKKIAGEQVSGEAREKFLREKNTLKLTTTIFFLLNNLLFAYDNFSDVYFNLRYKFSKFSILCSFYRRLFCNFQFSSLTQLYIAFE